MARLRATTGVGATASNWSYRATICDQSVCSSVAASACTALMAADAATDDRLSFVDQGAIPSLAVLLAEQRKAAVRANARCAAGLGQEQQRQQAGPLRLVGHQCREDPRQADRLGAETGFFGLAGLPGGVDEVDDGEHGA